jgi:DnaK suppressor protein
MPGKVKLKKRPPTPKAAAKKTVKPTVIKKDGRPGHNSQRSDRSARLQPVAARPAVGTSPTPTDEPVRARPATRYQNSARREALYRMLISKRQEILKQIEGVIGQSLTDDQQRRLESAMDVGDQALMDLERELGISLLEMQNKKRQSIDEALRRLAEGTYGICADCGVEISEKRLAAVPFARLCVECQTKQELLDRIEKEEERE